MAPVQYGITQCYLSPGRGDISAFNPTSKLILDLATTDGCKAELTYVTRKWIDLR